jgi:hypothetical protein
VVSVPSAVVVNCCVDFCRAITSLLTIITTKKIRS